MIAPAHDPSEPHPHRAAAPAPPGLRVAHAIHSGGFYGAEKVVCDLLDRQADRTGSPSGLRACLLAFLDPGQAGNAVADRAEARGHEVIRFAARPGISLTSLRAYARLIRSRGVGLVHSHGYKPTAHHIASRSLGLHRVPLVATAHGYPKGSGNWKATLYRGLDILLLGRAEAVAAVSGEMRNYLAERSPGCRLVTIPNGISCNLGLRGSHPLRRLLGDGPPVIGSAGRLVPMKNHALLIRAYALARRRFPCRLAILGDGPLRPSLEALWRELLPGEPVRLLPFQPDAPEWMADMDIFSLPSLDGEGLPMALLEAGLLELPVACSRSGGIPEVVRDRETGRLFDLADLPGLTQALLDMLCHPAEARGYGRALRREVADRHDIRHTHERYLETYAHVLAGN